MEVIVVSKYNDCLSNLLVLAEKKGYLTFDDIMDTTDSFDLSLSDVDRVSEAIQIREIIVYEESPEDNYQEELDDYSRVNYDEIFREIINTSEELRYLVDKVRELPPPQYKEISQLTMQNYHGNTYARERLILLHLRVVLKIALSMSKQYELNIVDAISCGIIGLITAVDRFDPNGFSAFQSYASLWITQHIQRECNPIWFEHYFPVHYKNDMLDILSKFEDKYGDFYYVTSKKELDTFLCEYSSELKHPDDKVTDYLNKLWCERYEHYYIDDVYFSDDEKDKNNSYASEKPFSEEMLSYGIEKETDLYFLKEYIREVLWELTEREEKVLALRYGLYDGIDRTLEHVGMEFNVTRERIRQIEAKAIKKLKHPSRSKKLKDYLDFLDF